VDEGLARRRPTHLAGASIGVGLAVALLACLGAFVDSSVKTMTHRAVAALPIDWQILLNSPSNEGAVRAAIHETEGQP
jgi:putative ABC transport system permease protein